MFRQLSILSTNYKNGRKHEKAIILSSGGVDSTTCLSVAVNALGAENVSTASIFYGQKHKKELDAARAVAAYYHVPHYEFDLAQIMQYSNCSLLSHSTESIVHKSYGEQIAEKGRERYLRMFLFGTAS